MLVQRQLLVTTVGLSLVVLAMFGAGIMAALSADSLANNIISDYSEINSQYNDRNAVKNAIVTLGTAKKSLASLSSFAVQQGRELQFINALENAATAAGVDQTIDLDTSSETQLSNWERNLPIRLQVKGAYPGVAAYLDAIGHLPYAMTIDSVTVNTASETGDGTVTAEIRGSIYLRTSTAPAYVTGS